MLLRDLRDGAARRLRTLGASRARSDKMLTLENVAEQYPGLTVEVRQEASGDVVIRMTYGPMYGQMYIRRKTLLDETQLDVTLAELVRRLGLS